MSIGDLATILTVAGVSIYVLGLIGLTIPIRREFTGGDISAAWYAVSLVPKTVVAGQGVRIWMRWALEFAVLLLMLTVALGLLLPLLLRLSPFGPDDTVLFAQVPIMVFVFFWFFRRLMRTKALTFFGPDLTRTLAAMLPAVVLVRIGILMIAYPEEGADVVVRGFVSKGGQDWPFFGDVFYPPGRGATIFRGVVVLLIGSFFLGLPFAIWTSPPLPKVRIIKQPEATIEGVPSPLEGWLVAHTNGFWHLFADADEEPREDTGEKRYDLISIHDDKALVVRTVGKEDAPAKAAPETHGQRDA